MIKILQKNESVLSKIAAPVALSDIGTGKINRIISDMITAMSEQKDGVAIAAPQIGISLQIFVVSGSLLKQADKTYTGEATNLVYINPIIKKLSKEKKDMEEGCLSVRWLYGKVKRATRVNLKYYNEQGKLMERGASGLLAQIFQHETDHLNGILFIDKADEIWEMSESEILEIQGKNDKE